MDTVWQELPIELSEYICNKLTKVRRCADDFKTKIRISRLNILFNKTAKTLGEFTAYVWFIDILLDRTHRTPLDVYDRRLIDIYEDMLGLLWMSLDNDLYDSVVEEVDKINIYII